MKNMKKVLALVLAMAMVLAMSAAVFASEVDSEKGGSASITITLPTEETAPTAKTTYKIYKVFDATNDGSSNAIAYTLVNGKTKAPAGFTVDAAGNVTYSGTATDGKLTKDDITAIAAYVSDSDLVYTAEVAAGETSVTVKNLEYGFYYITTSSGTVVTVDSTNPNATVNDKNTLPEVVKSAGTEYDANAMEAIAAVGSSQSYTANINVGNGTKNLVFTDTMTNQTYNGDAKVYVGSVEVTAGDTTFSISGESGASTFTITFADRYIASLDASTIITVKYSGTITSDALSKNPATNTAKITSGDGNESTCDPVNVYNAKLTVTKQDDKKQPLKGAGFVIAQTVADTSDGAAEGATKTVYYKLADDKKSVKWVDSIDSATEYKSDAEGAVTAFTGLGAGTYTLIEKTVPGGYNKAADQTFTIADANYTTANLEQTATVTNNAGSELPETGGIGTTIFYMVGAILVIGAGVVLITRRRMNAQ